MDSQDEASGFHYVSDTILSHIYIDLNDQTKIPDRHYNVLNNNMTRASPFETACRIHFNFQISM